MNCPRCGGRLSTNAVLGRLCPACLLERAFQPLNVSSTFTTANVLAETSGAMLYLADEDWPGRRRLVLKTGKQPLPSLTSISEFRERGEKLKQLIHPNVARIVEVALTGDRRPSMMMEYVYGPSIVRYADRVHLDRAGRDVLLSRVADAIHCAHALGIVHGNLNAAKVLVATDSGTPVPKLIGLEPVDLTEMGQSADLQALEALAADLLSKAVL